MKKITIATLALVLAFPAATFAGDINCAHPAQGPEAECLERVLDMAPEERDPIGYVAYVAPKCDYFIMRDHQTESFALVEYLRRNQSPKPHRGYEAFSRYHAGTARAFREGAARMIFGYDTVKVDVEASRLTAEEAVSAYMKACE